MHSRLSTLIAPALAAASLLAAAGPAYAATGKPHDTTTTTSAAAAPGRQVVPLSLPAAAYNAKNDTQLKADLLAALPGQVIHLASGAKFSTLWDTTARAGWVTVSGAGDAVTPVIDGANLEGSQYLRFTNIKFTGHVLIARHPVRAGLQPAENVQLLNSEVTCGATPTSPKGIGVTVRQASQNITLEGDLVDQCTLGFTTVAQDNPTQNLTLAHNTFQNFFGDAIDIGGIANTTIADNIIQNIHHIPGVVYHDDGIQFLGNTVNTTIQGNVLNNSGDQLIFIQDAIKGQYNGVQTNSDVVIDHNLIYGTGASAVQDQGAINARITNNTIWDSHDNALVVTKSNYTGTLPTGTVVSGNVLPNYQNSGANGVLENHNLIEFPTPHRTVGSADLVSVAPQFVNAAAGDFALVAGTPGSGTLNPPPSSTATTTATAAGTAVSLTTASMPTAMMQLGANPLNLSYGAAVFGITS
jgi:hypothetical protein